MSIDFPAAPLTVGQAHTLGRVVWTWDGIKWVAGVQAFGEGVSAAITITITGTATLPVGFSGFVKAENAGTAPISIFLPTVPSAGQAIEIKDTIGNAGTYAITVDGAGQMIEGAATMVIGFNYGWVDLMYTGTLWVQT